MAESYDLIIIGSGAAASTVAYPCREAGWRVAMIDHRPLGGTCVLRGCDPKKVLVGASDALDHARRLAGQGIVGDLRIDWPALMRRKRTFTDPIPANREREYADAGIQTIRGCRTHSRACWRNFIAPVLHRRSRPPRRLR